MSKKTAVDAILISLKDAATITTLTDRTLINMSRDGLFPPLVQISERRYAFERAAVMSYLADKIAAAKSGQRVPFAA